MATITGLTAERMLEIEDASIVDGEIVNGHLILTKHDGTTIDAGPVLGPAGPPGPQGPAAISAIPGEVKLWPNNVLPTLAEYGKWVWADGAVYAVATYPKAAGNIASQWRTFAGASDPGAPNFRVPDLRGLVPAGMDQMPGGARANRITRAAAIALAGKSGEELHTLTAAEMAHHHPFSVSVNIAGTSSETGSQGQYMIVTNYAYPQGAVGSGNTGAVAPDAPSPMEQLQPTVFVPYIVKLDD